jgi:hypothetical protein
LIMIASIDTKAILTRYPLGVWLQKPGSEEQFDPNSKFNTLSWLQHTGKKKRN